MTHLPIITRTLLDSYGIVARVSAPILPAQPGLKGNPAKASAHEKALMRSPAMGQWGHEGYSPEDPHPVHIPLYMVDWACAMFNQLSGESWRNE
jgi:hypothetical protein